MANDKNKDAVVQGAVTTHDDVNVAISQDETLQEIVLTVGIPRWLHEDINKIFRAENAREIALYGFERPMSEQYVQNYLSNKVTGQLKQLRESERKKQILAVEELVTKGISREAAEKAVYKGKAKL